MLKKSVFYCFAAMLLVSVLSTPGFGAMTATREPIAHQWPDVNLPGWTREVTSYVDPNSPTGPTGTGQRVQENFDQGRGMMQTFTVGPAPFASITDGNGGFNLKAIVFTEGGNDGPGDFSIHLFDLRTGVGANGGGYNVSTDSLPLPRYDWLSTNCTFNFWVDDNEPPLDYFVILKFTEYDSFDLEPNHLYAFEIWGSYQADAGMYWLRDAGENVWNLGGRAYECPGNANGSDPGQGPADLSAGRTSITSGSRDMPLAVYGIIVDGNAYHPLPRNYEPEADVSPTLTWHSGDWVADTQGHKLYFGTNATQVRNRNSAVYMGRLDTNSFSPGVLAFNTTYYWKVDEYNSAAVPPAPLHGDGNNYWGTGTTSAENWRFTTLGPNARIPVPRTGYVAEFSLNNLILSWTKGAWAADTDGHRVFFGTDFNEVNDATSATGPLVNRGLRTDSNYPLLNLVPNYVLEGGSTYYWRVDEINDTNLWKGPIWNFVMSPYIVVEDYPYGSQTLMDAAWKTGLMQTRFNCGDNDAPAGTAALANGTMRFSFDNLASGTPSNCPWSEAKADNNGAGLDMDWTVNGLMNIQSLAIGVDGNIFSAIDPDYDKLFLVIEDSLGNFGIVYCPDRLIQKRQFGNPSARQWYIDLDDPCLASVDVTDINAIYVGLGPYCGGGPNWSTFGPFGGTGVVAVDNIRIYEPICRTEYGGHNGPAGSADVAGSINSAGNWNIGDCTVNYYDLDYMFYTAAPTNDAITWLAQDQTLSYPDACAPPDTNMTVWYKFDETSGSIAQDSTPNDKDGTVGNPHSLMWNTDGLNGTRCLNFEPGFRTWVEVPTSAYQDPNNHPGTTGVTFSFWSAHDMNYQPIGELAATWDSVFTFHSKVPTDANAGNNNDDSQQLESQTPTPWPPTTHYWGPQIRFVDMRGGLNITVARQGSPWVRFDNFGRRWNHFVYVYNDDANTRSLYQNGSRIAYIVGDTNVPYPIWPAPGSFRLGTRSNRKYPGYGFMGPDWGFSMMKLEDFRVYNYALNDNQIQWLALHPQNDAGSLTSRELKDNANLYTADGPTQKINFRDYALMLKQWMLPPDLWP